MTSHSALPFPTGRLLVPGCVLLALIAAFMLACSPEVAQAALARAAGKEETARGGSGGQAGGGFADLFAFLNNLATYLIYIGAAFGVIGFIRAGVQFQAGNPQASNSLGGTVVGLALVLLAKGITL